jgi:hypothetical protein
MKLIDVIIIVKQAEFKHIANRNIDILNYLINILAIIYNGNND